MLVCRSVSFAQSHVLFFFLYSILLYLIICNITKFRSHPLPLFFHFRLFCFYFGRCELGSCFFNLDGSDLSLTSDSTLLDNSKSRWKHQAEGGWKSHGKLLRMWTSEEGSEQRVACTLKVEGKFLFCSPFPNIHLFFDSSSYWSLKDLGTFTQCFSHLLFNRSSLQLSSY